MISIKFNKTLLGIASAALLGMAGCQDSYTAPELEIPSATLQANTTIADFKAAFADELAVTVPYKDEATKTPYIIHGRVISSDASGNIYKSIVIQDETAAMAFSVNQGSMYIDYRLGQEVVVEATGLWVGQYNNYLQFGMLGEYNGLPQITFMAWDTFNAHVQKEGLPDPETQYVRYGHANPTDRMYCTVIDIDDIPTSGPDYLNIMSQLVEIPNVSFVDAGKDPAVTFAPYQDNADRYIKGASGKQLNVRCSGYSSFYSTPLPTGVGTVRGILSRYGDSWQLLLRGYSDVIFDSMGTVDEPYSVEQAIELQNNGRKGYVEGYVVGSLKFGLNDAVDSIDDIIFDVDGTESDNNLVIAPSADCRDMEKMMLVQLPAGSKIRQYANLLDNPDVMGHKLTVEGYMNQWLGMHAVTDVAAGFAAFNIEGIEIEGVTGQGSGTSEDPYTVDYVLAHPEEEMTAVWIQGYICGYVLGMGTGISYEEAVRFQPYDSGDYNGANILLGNSPAANSANQSLPVALTGDFRKQYGLKANPDKFGKHVKIQCNVSQNVLTVTGLNSISAIEEIE